jgi:hypothetical protein
MLKITEMLPNKTKWIKTLISQYCAELRVAIPAIIESFDKDKLTVKARIAIKEIVDIDGDLHEIEIPVLADVPVMNLTGGDYSITMPIKEGDECLIVFADMCIDDWWKNGGVKSQLERRRHNLSDGFAIIGFRSQVNLIDEYSEDSVQIRNKDKSTLIDLKDGQIQIKDGETVVTIKEGEITLQSSSKIDIKADSEINVEAPTVNVEGTNITVDGTNVNVKGTVVNLAEGLQGVARIGDSVNLETGLIITGSSKVLAG